MPGCSLVHPQLTTFNLFVEIGLLIVCYNFDHTLVAIRKRGHRDGDYGF